ncbi:MAG: class I SAM-dependent methyltransferase [Bacteroidia bacterium]|nr:class I SAM-dependent methyltransferase [Bacteroidia bacterium]
MSSIKQKEINHTFKDQKRWNEVYGKNLLDIIAADPEQFNIQHLGLTQNQKDLLDFLSIKIRSSKAPVKILDYGSGRGEFSIFLAKLGAEVVGIDIGEDLVNLATQIAAQNSIQCTFVCGSIDNLPFDDQSFDIVVGCAILHHLPKQGVHSSLREAYRVLKPNGSAFFTEPIENSVIFDFLQNMIPVGKPEDTNYRPSILYKKAWKKHLSEADDRALSNKELTAAKATFTKVHFAYYGMFIRFHRLWKNTTFGKILTTLDRYATHTYSPIKKLSQSVLVRYDK